MSDGAPRSIGGSPLPERTLLPTFLVIGAAKSGTTALHHYLGQHPDMYLPPAQEPSFFAFEGARPDFRGPRGTAASVNAGAVTSLNEYMNLFGDGAGRAARGEVSPVYLYWHGTAERIRRYIPDVKLCAILRNPIERAYSAYMHAMREGKEPLRTFQAGLRAEPERIQQNWGFLWRYTDMGRYSEQLRRYYDVFPQSQIKVVLYDDLRRDAAALCSELQAFIGVDPGFAPDVGLWHNVSGLPRSRMVQHVLARQGPLRRVADRAAPLVGKHRLRQWQGAFRNANLRRIPLPDHLRNQLAARFDREIDELERLLERDLNHWRGHAEPVE
ncbi:MAG: sulfotransferase family protein [Egibacteraceae bacterium]